MPPWQNQRTRSEDSDRVDAAFGPRLGSFLDEDPPLHRDSVLTTPSNGVLIPETPRLVPPSVGTPCVSNVLGAHMFNSNQSAGTLPGPIYSTSTLNAHAHNSSASNHMSAQESDTEKAVSPAEVHEMLTDLLGDIERTIGSRLDLVVTALARLEANTIMTVPTAHAAGPGSIASRSSRRSISSIAEGLQQDDGGLQPVLKTRSNRSSRGHRRRNPRNSSPEDPRVENQIPRAVHIDSSMSSIPFQDPGLASRFGRNISHSWDEPISPKILGSDGSQSIVKTLSARSGALGRVHIRVPERSTPINELAATRFNSQLAPTMSSNSTFFTISARWAQGVENPELIMPVDKTMESLNSHNRSEAMRHNSHHYSSVDGNDFPAAPRCVIRPGSYRRLTWDVVGLVVLLYDLITVPLFLAFDMSSTTLTDAISWLLLAFWSTDIILNFNTGVYVHGVQELRRYIIAAMYIRSWFVLDIGLVLSDFAFLVLNTGGSRAGVEKMGNSVRSLRLFRFLRLIRVLKVKQFVQALEERVNSDVAHIFVHVVKLVFLVLLANHLIACGWYVVGSEWSVTNGWVKRYVYEEESMTYLYVTALHWSLTQFTTGSMEVFAESGAERVYSVATLVFALMAFSSVLSSITSAMTQLRQLSNMHDHKLSLLRRYLRARRIPNNLTTRIMRYVQHKLATQKRSVQESDVQLLLVVSDPLMRELRQCLHQPFLMKHPFFRRYAEADSNAMQYTCNNAIGVAALSVGDTLFTQRTSDGLMFFLVVGRLHYFPSRALRMSSKARGAKVSLHSNQSVGSGNLNAGRLAGGSSKMSAFKLTLENENILGINDWCCEGTLWTHWFHLGRMQATQVSEVLAMDAEKFADAVHIHPHLFEAVKFYATSMVSRLNSLAAAGCLTDLPAVDSYLTETFAKEAFTEHINATPSVSRRFIWSDKDGTATDDSSASANEGGPLASPDIAPDASDKHSLLSSSPRVPDLQSNPTSGTEIWQADV